MRAALRGWLRLEVEGSGHVPSSGAFIVAATHGSHADSLALGAAVERPLTFLGDRGLTGTPLLGPLLPRMGFLPVDRGTGDRDVLRELARMLADDEAGVVIYAEGSRSRDGRVHRPRSGVSRLAATSGVPVVPAGIRGTELAWPIGMPPRLRGPRPGGSVRVRIGAVMAPPEDTPGARRAWSDALHDELVRLAGRPRAEGFAPVGGAVAVDATPAGGRP